MYIKSFLRHLSPPVTLEGPGVPYGLGWEGLKFSAIPIVKSVHQIHWPAQEGSCIYFYYLRLNSFYIYVE